MLREIADRLFLAGLARRTENLFIFFRVGVLAQVLRHARMVKISIILSRKLKNKRTVTQQLPLARPK
jgi:hypothetical protein